MRGQRIVLFLGIWVAILPYLGFPYSWKNSLFTVSGLILIYYSYLLYKDHKKHIAKQEIFDNFKENTYVEIIEDINVSVSKENIEQN